MIIMELNIHNLCKKTTRETTREEQLTIAKY